MRTLKSFKIILLALTLILNQADLQNVPNRAIIESNLANITSELKIQEAKVVKSITQLGLLANISSCNLKASNVSKVLTDLLDNMTIAVNNIRTIDDHEISTISLDNLTSYDYIQYRIATSFSDVRYYKAIINAIHENESTIQEFTGNVSAEFERNIKTFLVLVSKAKTVSSIIRQSMAIYTLFGDYIQVLLTHIDNLMRLNSYLTSLIVTKTVISSNTTLDEFMTKMRNVQFQLVPNQQRLITSVKIALNKIAIADKSVATAVKATLSKPKADLKKLNVSLVETSTVNDYSLVAWPRLPDIPDHAATVRLRSSVCDKKTRDFKIIIDSAVKNNSRISLDRETLNASTFDEVASSKKKVQAQSPALVDVISATLNVESSLVAYIAKLQWALNETMLLKEEYTSPCGELNLSVVLSLL